jgi:hypothetical protein
MIELDQGPVFVEDDEPHVRDDVAVYAKGDHGFGV